MQLAEALRYVHGGGELSADQSEAVIRGALAEAPDAVQLGGLLAMLAQRGEATLEILGAARALRNLAVPFEHSASDAIDTCGTGGDGLGTFNLSTASALVAAAAGAKVIKHGNRSVSSSCGSADLLEACGVALDLSPAQARAVFEEMGITYLHAPLYHPAMGIAAPIRRSLGIPTLFNLLGPLANPGRVRRQVLGVAQPERLDTYAALLNDLGHERGLVVHGGGGADELTLEDGNRSAAVGDMPAFPLDPRELGLDAVPVAALAGGDVAKNVSLFERLLAGDGGPLRDALLYNSAAALVVAGVSPSGTEGLRRAADAIDSGAARARLAQWAALSQAVRA